MGLFCDSADLVTESDVEQKLLWLLLTSPNPLGLGYSSAEVRTKHDIRALTIDKREKAHLYYPDYAVILAGLPMLIVEAKRPGEDLQLALREARLYATELNSQFPSGLNPCDRIVVSDGRRLISAPWDSGNPDVDIPFEDIDTSNIGYARFIELNGRDAIAQHAEKLQKHLTKRPLHLPLSILGGRTVRNEEIGHNTFGATLALDYRHLFNPMTPDERAFIVKHAYVRSLRRDRYVDPIDRLIRAASPPSVSDAKLVEDTSRPDEIIARLRRHKSLEHQVLLLVGGVGAGKSTFVDYIREVAISDELKDRTSWVHVDLNYAPLSEADAYRWLVAELVTQLHGLYPDIDFDDIEVIQKVYSVEIARLRKGPLSLLEPTSVEYKTRWVDEIRHLQQDHLASAQAHIRYLCGERGQLLVLVLDNCDKRTRDEQLLMFQIAQWAQRELHCLIFLPIRDVTYDHHRSQPPLDTALKDLVFRIEPPQFGKVLQRRVQLALAEMAKSSGPRKFHYELPNGWRVEYPRSDLGMYLAAILRSLYEYDRLVRRMITGLAGRDIRRAMEIFLEFCTSGHIGEHEILKMRKAQGAYSLPYNLVVRVLLRMNRRFYEGDQSFVKNVFQCNPSDSRPDTFCRLAVLGWLRDRWPEKGPTGIRGYHQVRTLIRELIPAGHDSDVIKRELLYLIAAKCAIAEHQRTDAINDDDLVCLSPAGVVHLDLVRNADYLAACAEDTWLEDEGLANAIAGRIGGHGLAGHYTRVVTLDNAYDFSEYLRSKAGQAFPCPSVFMKNSDIIELPILENMAAALQRTIKARCTEIAVDNLPWSADAVDLELAFSQHVPVLDAKVEVDAGTGRSRGRGIVRVPIDDAEQAASKMNGQKLGGRQLRVYRLA